MTCRAGWTRLHRLNACWIMLCILCMLFSCAVILVPVFVQRSSELRLYVLALSRVNLQSELYSILYNLQVKLTHIRAVTTALGATALGVLLVGLCGYCMGLKSSSPLSDRLMTTFSWLLVCTSECFRRARRLFWQDVNLTLTLVCTQSVSPYYLVRSSGSSRCKSAPTLRKSGPSNRPPLVRGFKTRCNAADIGRRLLVELQTAERAALASLA